MTKLDQLIDGAVLSVQFWTAIAIIFTGVFL